MLGSLSSALAAAIKGYKEKYKKDNAQLVEDFKAVISAEGGGVPLVSEVKQKGNKKTDIGGIFIRNDVPEKLLPSINAILGEELSIEPIDNESYNELMRCDTQVDIDVPITQNGLPDEIEQMVKDVVGYEQVGTTPFFSEKMLLMIGFLNLIRQSILIPILLKSAQIPLSCLISSNAEKI